MRGRGDGRESKRDGERKREREGEILSTTSLGDAYHEPGPDQELKPAARNST